MYQSSIQRRPKHNLLDRQIPKPSYRNAAAAGPWPYIDNLADQESEEVIDTKIFVVIGSCGHDNCEDCKNWTAYPQSLFGNWTIKPVRKSGIERAVTDREHSSTIYTVDVLDNGVFGDSGEYRVTTLNKREYWRNVLLSEASSIADVIVQSCLTQLSAMSGPVLQMLGTRYTIEPYFFSSSINWIPSRYQENPIPKTGDHITITLTFLRSMDSFAAQDPCDESIYSASTKSRIGSSFLPQWLHFRNENAEMDRIDTHAPLLLRSNKKILLLDLLAIHMVRNVKGSTLISYHHPIDGSTSAEDLFTRLKLVGRSVYWQLIIRNSKDPTFVFLAALWSALYAWDEALEILYGHFTWLESRIIRSGGAVLLIRELHLIRAYLLHYTTLLWDFKNSVIFIRDTPNPAMDSYPHDQRDSDRQMLFKECGHLMAEIERLQLHKQVLDDRVQNVKQLVYDTVNLGDSKAMKRLSFLTMIFLPGSFMAVFLV